jgi:hypothetical protein
MMPALNGAGGAPVGEQIMAYLSYGFSCLPIAPGTKKPYGLLLPDGTWKPYQQKAPTPAEVQSWINQRPDLGVGIICGPVSGRLACMDVDDPGFATYLEGSLAPKDWHGMWVVRTGSGLLHLYARSHVDVYTTNIVGAGRKLADIRGNGQGHNGPSYMVAPPSAHPHGGHYRTIAGDPQFVPTVSDAAAVFNTLKDMYVGSAAVTQLVSPGVPEDQLDTGDKTIMARDAANGPEIESWLGGIHISRKVKKAILEGAHFGEGMWSGAPSDSEIDHRIITELREAGFSIQQIEAVFAWSPVGQNCYANTGRSNHGRGYLTSSITKIDRHIAEAKQAATQAAGTNFTVVQVLRVGYEEPVFECTIHCTDTDTRGVAHLRALDLMDEHHFKLQVLKEMNFLPTVPKHHSGRKFEEIGKLIARMAGLEAVPQVATEAGHLRGIVRMLINREVDPIQPEDERMMRFGWRNGTNVYMRGIALLQHLQVLLRPSPRPEKVWAVLRAMGGEEEGWKWTSGRREALWVLPVGTLED